jgi:hypothetical protein
MPKKDKRRRSKVSEKSTARPDHHVADAALDGTRKVKEAPNPTWRHDPAGSNAPLGSSSGASGMVPQSVDDPSPNRERFRERT